MTITEIRDAVIAEMDSLQQRIWDEQEGQRHLFTQDSADRIQRWAAQRRALQAACYALTPKSPTL